MTTDSTTPTTTSAPAPASTPTPAPVSSAPDTTAPAATWEQAFEAAEAAGTSDPGDEDSTPVPPASATTTPAVEEPPPAVEDPASAKGPIPFERHAAILKNAREKAQTEIVAKVEQMFGPGIQLQQQLRANPIGTLTQLIDEAMADPNLGPQIVSHAARTLSTMRGRKAADQEPQADAEAPDGSLYYSEGQKAKHAQWLQRQLMTEVERRIAPIEQERQQRVQQEALEGQRAAIRDTVGSRLSAWRERPGFTEHEAAIAEAQQGYVAQGIDPWNAMAFAYTDIVVPKLRADTQTTFVKAAVAKAKASTANPATTAPAPAHGRPTTWDEAFKQVGLT